MSHTDHCPHCGGDIAPQRQRRSLPQHKRYFSMIEAALYHWPNAHPFQPEDKDELRGWLQCKAGHYTTSRIEVPSTDPAIMALARLAAEAAIKASGGKAWIKPFDGGLVVFTPKSISFGKLDHRAACRLFDEVAQVIESEIGIKADDLMREHEAAA